MTEYIVHIYREMRLSYTGIEAETPEAAAAIAAGKPTGDADNVEDCDGQDLAALVDTAGDDDYSQSVTIDFEAERHRKAAPKLLAALLLAQTALNTAPRFRVGDTDSYTIAAIVDAAIAKAQTADIPSASIPTNQPSRFEFEHLPLENADRAYVLVDGALDVKIVRTGEGIVIDVYPKDWIDPIDSLTVWDEDVTRALAEADAIDAAEA
jgi:hypothetical protein